MIDGDYETKYHEVARLQHWEIERLHGELNELRTQNSRLLDWTIMGEEPDAPAQPHGKRIEGGLLP
jgi:hypothetical protein